VSKATVELQTVTAVLLFASFNVSKPYQVYFMSLSSARNHISFVATNAAEILASQLVEWKHGTWKAYD